MHFAYTSNVKTGSTLVLHGEDAMCRILQFIANAKSRVDIFGDQKAPSVVAIEECSKALLDCKKRGVKVRFVTEITRENVSYCRKLMGIVELAHAIDARGMMAVSDSEFAGTVALQEGKVPSQLIYSSVKSVVEYQHDIFVRLRRRESTQKVSAYLTYIWRRMTGLRRCRD
jgi:hypothetical protein